MAPESVLPRWPVLLTVLCALGCPRPTPPAADRRVVALPAEHEPADDEIARLVDAHVTHAVRSIEPFFGVALPRPFRVRILPDRAALDAFWRAEWEQPAEFASECWMVASGDVDMLSLLSPRVWKEQACEHDPDDDAHVRLLLTHEVIHVLHHQLHPRQGLDLDDSIGWFVEGVAVFGSGQLGDGHLATAREALDAGAAPAELERAWSGKYRYGVSGSLVAYVDHCWGRRKLVELMRTSTEEQLLGALGITEPDLLSTWAVWVRDPETAECPRPADAGQ
jgi:hypothetical protein